jgi:rhomboid family GlyGly-CTERM serine protease
MNEEAFLPMPSLPSMLRRLPCLTLFLAAVAVGVYQVPGDGAACLQFERAALSAGEAWRHVTGHLTHFDVNHLAWDVGALLVLGTICEASSRRQTAVALGLASLAIPAAIWTLQPWFETYRGLSGLDSALFGLYATSLLRRGRRDLRLLGVVALLGVLAKSAFEFSSGTTVFATGAGYAPVPLAHLVGVLCGIAAAFLGRPTFRRGSCSAAPPPCRRSRPSRAPAPSASC